MPKRAILLLLLQCVTAAIAHATIQPASVEVETPPGDYVLFSSKGPALAVPSDAVTSKGGKVEVPVSGKNPHMEIPNSNESDHLYVWDKTTGALAERTSINPWKVSQKDFTRIETVTVAAQHNGQPLSSGEVSLGDGDPRHTAIIDQSAPANFFDVEAGPLTVTVKYRERRASTGSVTQVFTAAPKPDGLNLTVAVADDVAAGTGSPTTSETPIPAAGGVQGPPKIPSQPANPVGVIAVWLIAIVAVGFIVYNLMRFMKSNPGTVGQKLQQLGVQVPQPGDAGLSLAQPIMPAAAAPPQPVQKITLDDAAPDPVAPFASAPVAAVSTGQPSLLSSSGVAIPLSDGETIVGREPGLGLSLTADSTVSRRHATLQKVGNDVTVTDLGSSNGTYVNGAKIQTPTVLRQGDAVQFGSAQFQYVS